jgi:hypothetical protein
MVADFDHKAGWDMITIQEITARISGPRVELGIKPSVKVAALSKLVIPSAGGDIHVKIAEGRGEHAQAFELLAESYRARGYEVCCDKPYRFTSFHVLPDTINLIAERQGRVCATMSVVPDTRLLGLPMESIYGPEIAALRRQGRRLFETTSLADSGLSIGEFIKVFIALIKLGMHSTIRQGADSWVITVNPRHRNFYRKAMGFVPLGPVRSYPSVQDHPAEAFLLDVPNLLANAPEMHEKIFGEPLADSLLTPSPLSPADVRHFAWRSTQLDSRSADDLLLSIEHFGSPPRWREDDETFGSRVVS